MNTNYLQHTFGLQGRTALITGAGQGMGLAIAAALGAAGARVLINDVRAEVCQQAAQTLKDQGLDATGLCFDVADRAAVLQVAADLASRQSSPDILISHAGNQNRKPLLEMSAPEWQKIFDVHLGGARNCLEAFLPRMCTQGWGRVVFTSSVSAQATMPLIAAYSTAKAAVSALARAVAVEYGGKGVTANAIAPGFVKTEFTTGLQQREGFEQYLQEHVPAARWAVAEDIAPAVLFLVSAGGSYVNGQTLAIDGGLLARL